jgi:hypothetical protein
MGIEIVVLTVPFIFVIAMVLLGMNEKHKRNLLQADLYIKSLEKGLPIPAELFAEPKQKTLHTGIILIAVSIGISLLFWLMDMVKIASVGLPPFMVGVAHVIIYFIEKKKESGENAK